MEPNSSIHRHQHVDDSLLNAIGESYKEFLEAIDDDDDALATLEPYTITNQPRRASGSDRDIIQTLNEIDGKNKIKKVFSVPIFIVLFYILTKSFFMLRMANRIDQDTKFSLLKDMPIYLDISGNGGSFISSALSECYGITVSSEDAHTNGDDKIDLIATDSLCNIDVNHMRSNVFLINRNPIFRILLSFIEQKNPRSPSYNKIFDGMKFEEYSNSSLHETNLLTRRILCINDGRELTHFDIQRAKNILRRKSFIVFRDYETVYNALHSSLLAKPSSYKDENCFVSHFKKMHSIDFNNFFGGMEEFKNYFEMLQKANTFDMQLYSMALH